MSRESVRRARARLVEAMRDDARMRVCGERVSSFVCGAAVGGDLVAAAAAAAGAELVSSRDGFEVALRILVDTGQLPAPSGGDLLGVGGTAGAAALARELSHGRPHEIPSDDETAVQAANTLMAAGRARRLDGGAGEWVALTHEATADSPAGRAARRLVTMSGPLPWSDFLAAWQRGAGRAPHGPLPADVTVLHSWLEWVPGVRVRRSPDLDWMPVVEACEPTVEMDRVGQFLLETLAGAPQGMSRGELLAAAEPAGLRASSVAAALSYHPAVVNIRWGAWALRRSPERPAPVGVTRPAPQRRLRPRPTTYSWAPTGDLVLQFSAPASPSPVFAVPAALAGVVEGRDLSLSSPGEPATSTLTFRNARVWGFALVLSSFDPIPGDRFDLTCDLVGGAATLSPAASRKES